MIEHRSDFADPAEITDWDRRLREAWLPWEMVDGRPVCPKPELFDVAHGNNKFRHWAEKKMVDVRAVAARRDGADSIWHVLMVLRGDGYGWALPGGGLDPGEDAVEAALRELREETTLTLKPWIDRSGQLVSVELDEQRRGMAYVGGPRIVADPRGSWEAWPVTRVMDVYLGVFEELPGVRGESDARQAAWIPFTADTIDIPSGGYVFQAHLDLLAELQQGLRDDWRRWPV